MAAAIPEIILVIRNQLALCYDIGVANGKEDKISKELLVSILASTSGMIGIGLVAVHGSKILVKRASLKVLQKIIAILGGKITQKLLKSMVSKWIPGVGAAAMAIWAKLETQKIGNAAKELFSKDIEYSTEEVNSVVIPEVTIPVEKEVFLIEDKLKLLCNLMKIDGTVDVDEISFIETMLEAENASSELSHQIIANISNKEMFTVDLKKYSDKPDQAISIVVDLVAMAKRDGKVHITESMFLKQVSKSLNIAAEDTMAMLNES